MGVRQLIAGHSRLAAGVALVLLSVIWGYNWVILKVALRFSSPFTFAALRTALATASLFMILVALRRPLRPVKPLQLAWLGLLQTTGFIGCTMWALVSGAAGKTAVLTYTMPFWVIVFAKIVLGERMQSAQKFAVTLAFLGLIMVLAPWQPQGDLKSNLIAVVAGIFWAAGTLYTKILRRQQNFDLLSLTSWQMLFGAVGLIIIAALLPEPPVQWSGLFVGALVYNVFLGNALAWFLWLYALDTLPAGVASLGILATPVIGVVFAAVQLHEKPAPPEILGMLLIGLALLLISVHAIRQHRRISPTIGQE